MQSSRHLSYEVLLHVCTNSSEMLTTHKIGTSSLLLEILKIESPAKNHLPIGFVATVIFMQRSQ